jgi:hypothetical protein
MDTYFSEVPHSTFSRYIGIARKWSEAIRYATSDTFDPDGRYFLSGDGMCGYGIVNGELVGVHSRIHGHGADIMRSAIKNGATHLDCFDGFLPEFYARFGFTETRREANWSENGPDVVYMAV